MRQQRNASDPGPAGGPAKNCPAGPGLPNHTDSDMRRSPMVAASSTPRQEPDHAVQAFTALVEAVAVERDFAGWLTAILAAVTARAGGIGALTEGRPGSWEATQIEEWMRSAGCDIPAALDSHLAYAHELGGEAR